MKEVEALVEYEEAPNKALEPTPDSLRSCVAPAIGRGSPRALGARGAGKKPEELAEDRGYNAYTV